MSKANLAKEHDILHYKIHLKWSFLVPLIQGKGIAIGVEYETGMAKIGNQVKTIISTQL